jgi:hypothetical protein
MNVLKDENVSEDVKLVCDNDLNKKANVEINKSPVNVDSNDIVNISTNDSGDLIQFTISILSSSSVFALKTFTF